MLDFDSRQPEASEWQDVLLCSGCDVTSRTAALTTDKRNLCTLMTEGSSVGRLTTVTGETLVLLNTSTLILTEGAVAAAVARAAGSHPWGDLGPLLQVQSDAVQLQSTDAAQEALLPRCSPSCQWQRFFGHIFYASATQLLWKTRVCISLHKYLTRNTR